MKVYISVDIEGVTGVTAWDETELNHPDHKAAALQMTREAVAACEGAIAAGADEIIVKDAHATARNMDIHAFPEQVKLCRGWTNTPESMVAGIDETFDAAIFIGYHSGAGFDGNPLSHTMNQQNNYVKINGRQAAEFDMNAYVAAYYGVPVVFLSGDEELCAHAKELIPELETVGVKSGEGNMTTNIHPAKACALIKDGVQKGLAKLDSCKLESPERFELEINFKDCVKAHRGSFYPGAEKIDPNTACNRNPDAG